MSFSEHDAYQQIKRYFFGCSWNEAYDFVVFIANNPIGDYTSNNVAFAAFCNDVMERDLSAYRFVNGRIAEMTSEEEIAEVEEAQQPTGSLRPVARHLNRALALLADRDAPDYHDSIKEAISAVEAMCNLIAESSSATLGQTLKKLARKNTVTMHPALKDAFNKLYGYTSNAEGIRHALLKASDLDFEDAKFTLVSCSAFINYLRAKSAKAGINLWADLASRSAATMEGELCTSRRHRCSPGGAQRVRQEGLCKGCAVTRTAERMWCMSREEEISVSEAKNAPDTERGMTGTPVTRPERVVAEKPPPEPNYPRYRVEPGSKASLSDINPDQTEHYRKKKDIAKELEKQRRRIQDLQERLYAENEQGLLIVLQAMDTGGKDGTIKHVFGGINPQGCRVSSFKVPSAEEANHDFLWRYHKSAPAKGRIGIFNRSHYEDVLVVRVKNLVPEKIWRPRYEIINDFERSLTLDSITVLKFFLHISKDEQKRRLQRRLDNPDKRWKFDHSDIRERLLWDEYQEAYQDMIIACSTEHAPWYVVPANKKWYRNLVVARTIADTLEAMDPHFPAAEEGLENVAIPD